MGLKEQIVFPEIDYDNIDTIRGMDICVVTSAKSDEEGKELLKNLISHLLINEGIKWLRKVQLKKMKQE